MKSITAIRLLVYGRVQGVGFRYYTHKKALELGICGFVRNQADGSVSIEAEGKSDQLEQFVLWCQEGPSWARVLKLEQQQVPVVGYDTFEIK